MNKTGRRNLTIALFIGLACWSSPAARAGKLSDAVKADDLQGIQALISSGSNVNELDDFGTPLHMAAARGSVEIVKLLIDAGANVEAETAAPSQNKAHPLHTAAYSNRATVAALLIERGAKVDARDSRGFTPLMIAASSGNTKVAELLLQAGADPLAEDSGDHDIPIYVAAMNGHVDVVKLLLSKGVNVNVQNTHTGETPLWVAAMDDRLDVMEFLLANGADPNIANSSGKAPIHVGGSSKAKDLLRKFGAKE